MKKVLFWATWTFGVILLLGIIGSTVPSLNAVLGTQTTVTPTTQPTATLTPEPTIEPTATNTPTPTKKPVYIAPTATPTSVPAANAESGGLSNNNHYTNVDGNEVHSPAYSDSVPEGASAICGDGTYSFSQNRRGTCSHHGGVTQWL